MISKIWVTVGGRRRDVVVSGDLRDGKNEPAFAIYRPATKTIYLDSTIPSDDRMEMLIHELNHAWDDIAGRIADDDEARATRSALVLDQLNRDLAAQGGEAALHMLFGDYEIPQPQSSNLTYAAVEGEVEDWPTRVVCNGCRTIYPASAIKNGQPYIDTRQNGFMMNRMIICAKCEMIQEWGQRCSQEGVPWPVIVIPPTRRRIPLDEREAG